MNLHLFSPELLGIRLRVSKGQEEAFFYLPRIKKLANIEPDGYSIELKI